MPATVEVLALWADAEVCRPFEIKTEESGDRDNRYLNIIGRLKPSVCMSQAEAEMTVIGGADWSRSIPIMMLGGVCGGLFKRGCGLPQKLLFPLRDLMRMQLVPRRDLIDCFLGFERFQSDLRLEVTREFPSRPFASLSHVHFQCAFYLSQGSQFTSAEWLGLLQDRGIHVSLDGRGRAYDNIFIERLWHTVKWEQLFLWDHRTMGESAPGWGTFSSITTTAVGTPRLKVSRLRRYTNDDQENGRERV